MQEFWDFVQLIYEACHASEAVDYFDVRSDNPANDAAFQWLLVEQQKAFLALAQHVQANAEAIIIHIGDPPTIETEPPPKLLRTDELMQARHAFLSRYAITAERAAGTRE